MDFEIIFIIIGIIIMVEAFFGFCGALMKNACMVQTYANFLGLLLLSLIGLSVAVWVYKVYFSDSKSVLFKHSINLEIS